MLKLKRKTTCTVQKHGTKCEAAKKDNFYPRSTEKHLALKCEMKDNI